MVNYYKEFNLDPSLKGEQLADALKNVQRKWVGRTNAPDLNRRQEAERKVAMIEDAQKILLDDNKKVEYDNQLNNAVPTQSEMPSFNLDNNENAASLIDQAWGFINVGKYPDAIMAARRATEIEGNNADAWATLGYADYLWNNVQEAVYEYKKAISLRPNSDSFYCDLGNIYLDHNMINDSEDCAKKAIHINPNASYNKVLLGNVASNKNEYDKAISIFSELIKEEPNNESFKKVLADNYYFKGLSYCYHAENGYFYNIDENSTKQMIECMRKAKEYVNEPELDQKIAWGEKSLKKTFDKSKWTLFAIPVVCFLTGGFKGIFLGIVFAAGLGYLCMRPLWRLTRNSMLGEKTAFDTIATIFTSTVGVIFSAIWGGIKGLLGAMFGRY
jgi:tetratricopeptide (TPR) repeat protein